MNVLFLSLLDFNSLNERNIYTDLMQTFVDNHHYVYIVSPIQKRVNKSESIILGDSYKILKPVIGNITKTKLIEKGLSTITLESRIMSVIKREVKDKIDLVIYSTPPISYLRILKYLKSKYNPYSYLLLKDIFPQNAIDLGLLNKNGLKGIIYKYFRNKEEKLYSFSDKIGCMSIANLKYI